MMLGYVHDTTKIWQIWDFKSGRSGRAVECSSVIFQEEESAHGISAEEEKNPGFPEQIERSYEIIEDHPDPQGKLKKKKKKKIGPMETDPERTEPAGKGWEQPMEAEPEKAEPAGKGWEQPMEAEPERTEPAGKGWKEKEKKKPENEKRIRLTKTIHTQKTTYLPEREAKRDLRRIKS